MRDVPEGWIVHDDRRMHAPELVTECVTCLSAALVAERGRALADDEPTRLTAGEVRERSDEYDAMEARALAAEALVADLEAELKTAGPFDADSHAAYMVEIDSLNDQVRYRDDLIERALKNHDAMVAASLARWPRTPQEANDDMHEVKRAARSIGCYPWKPTTEER